MHHDDDREPARSSGLDRRRVGREAATLLHEHRERLDPPPGAADASWHALQARIRAGEADPLVDDSPAPRRSRARGFVLAAVAIAAAVALWRLAPQGVGRGAEQGALSAIFQRVDADGSRRAALRQGDRAAVRPDMSHEPDASAPAPDTAVPKDSLARELAQVRAAGEAVRDGRGREALAAAEGYLREHAGGAFAPEARLHRAEALCLLGRGDEARAATAAFLREVPGSPLRARMSAVCAEPARQK